MRAKEFINENLEHLETSNGAYDSIPGARIWPELDNSSPYDAYRFGIALAGAPSKSMPKRGPVKQNMVTLGYSDVDDEIAVAAGKIMGVRSKMLTPKGSNEKTNTNTASPIAKIKKNKYGV